MTATVFQLMTELTMIIAHLVQLVQNGETSWLLLDSWFMINSRQKNHLFGPVNRWSFISLLVSAALQVLGRLLHSRCWPRAWGKIYSNDAMNRLSGVSSCTGEF